MTRRDLPWAGLTVVVAVIYAFILAPVLITAAVSFNGTNRSFFPPRGFSLRWWGEVFKAQWMEPLLFSLELAACTALIATAIGVPLAFAFQRHDFPGKQAVRAVTLGPLILPTLVTGIALLQALTIAGFGRWIGFWALLIGHVIICLPFSVRTVAISLQAMPATVESAAASLGASPVSVLRHVTLPLVMPGVFAGLAFAFIHSFTDVNLSIFLAKAGQRPVTVAILAFLEFGFAPTLAALSMLTLVVPLVLIAVLGRFVGLGEFLYAEQSRG